MVVAAKKAQKVKDAAEKAKKAKEAAKPKGKYETIDDYEVEIKSKVNKKDFAGKYKQAKPTADKNMQINEHPVWIKVAPSENRFAYYQLGYWYIYDIKKLPQILKENKEKPDKRFVGYISSENKVDPFQEAIWNDRKDLLKPYPLSNGRVVVSADKPEEDPSTGEIKAKEEEDDDQDSETEEKEEKDDSPQDEDGDAKEDVKPAKKKKTRWITYKRKPAHHPTDPGVKMQKERDIVKAKREASAKKIMQTV